jgi:hypothetical protein
MLGALTEGREAASTKAVTTASTPATLLQASTSNARVVGDVVATLGSSAATIVVTHRVRQQ